MSYPMPGSAFGAAAGGPRGDAPLVLLFERDDTMAVPLLSQLRLAGYDVRAARTPVDLFDAAQKHAVALIIVDLGNAAANRREFWVALDAQRRGRATQVLTFRVVSPTAPPLADLDATPHALADLEVGGPQEVPLLVAAVSHRVPVSGTPPGLNTAPAGVGAIDGMALVGHPAFGATAGASQWHQESSSPFASPAPGNPFAAVDSISPFDQPDARNPFASSTLPPAPSPASSLAWTQQSPDRLESFASLPAASAMPPAPPGAMAPLTPATHGYVAPTPLTPGKTPSNGRAGYPEYAAAEPDPFLSPPPVTDAWMPPDGAALPFEVPSGNGAPFNGVAFNGVTGARPEPTAEGATEPRLASNGHQPADVIARADPARSFMDDLPQPERPTAPVAVQPQVSTGGALITPDERALGAVLVEGALLSPQRLEVLAEIRQMLSRVEVDVKLGELALLFRLLSPDQLLAALLVSRRLITPEQIAALGRIKQEMGASGINYDLETLLVMFNIMSREDLERLRGELA